MSTCQLELIRWENPLGARVGPEFFRELPSTPGVYRMLSREAEVIYVGSSRNLRNRVASYRSISSLRHSRRLCRLVHAVAAIHIELTETEADARSLEASWIRHYRPRFNRALNRPLESIWIGLETTASSLVTRWTPRENEHLDWPSKSIVFGPFPHRKFVHWLQSLRRTLWWTHAEEIDLRTCPIALLRREKPPHECEQRCSVISAIPDPASLAATLLLLAEQRAPLLAEKPWNRPLVERWEEDRKVLAQTDWASHSL